MASVGGTLGLSGLPLTELLDNLRKAEEAPLTALANRKTIAEARISAYGMISSALSTLQTAAKDLGKGTVFGTMKATSSDTAALSAKVPAGEGAVAGKYTIAIEKLAANQSLASAGQASRQDPIGSGGTITFTLGDGSTKTVTLADGDTSLEALRTAINKATVGEGEDEKRLGITATLLNNGDAGNPHQLVLSTDDTGTAARITKIEVSGNAELAQMLDFDEGAATPGETAMRQVAAAQDAALTINGIAVTSGKNTLEDAIEGVTLNLLAPTTEGAPLTLTIAQDNTAGSTAVQSFVTTYNSLQSVIRQLTSYDAQTQTSSALTGDRVARSVQSQLRNVLGEAIENGGFATLAQIGITTNITTGALDIDTTKLNQMLAEDPAKVAALFTGENGLSAKLDATIKTMLGTDGLIANAQEGLKSTVEDIGKQYTRMETRIDDTMARYQAQFVALEKLMSQMNTTSSYLTQQLDMLAATAKNSR
ncbi:hypothetical protein FOZ76_09630 [Verticiella sediminum]|uniref:Flagellar hook-associated protein 2 n=1 Tax=Verticiella sediminum TaxID=1247510 RepID=A0A556ARV1_9BURK|nr:flagellar filament capping protein FliD [Verticiella sediminum]TSH95653.1 hypothetical protein FOZ76_09630 [Verticiella sediminum]